MLISKQGYEIPYIYEGTGNEKKIVIISHGFGSSKESPTAVTAAARFNEAGIGAVRYDHPAHGDSPVEGDFFRVEYCLNDLESVENMIAEKYPEAEISYFSSSFGAFINLIYISTGKRRGVRSFLRCAAVDMPGIIKSWFTDENYAELEKKGFLMIDEDYVRPLKVVKGFCEDLEKIDLFEGFDPKDTELLMIHGTEDETAPYEDAAAFANKYGIRLISVEGSDHRFTPEGAMDIVREAAVEFINII